MSIEKSSRPNFVGIGWAALPQGYTFLRPPTQYRTEYMGISDKNEWETILEIFTEASNGKFQHIELLPNLIRNSSDFHLKFAGLKLMGDASTDSDVLALADFFQDSDPDIRYASYSAAASSSNLNLIRELIQSTKSIKPGVELELLSDSVSEVLEWSYDSISEPVSYQEFRSISLDKIDEIETRIGKNIPIMYGEILDIRNVVKKIGGILNIDNLSEYNDLAYDYISKFESMTGMISSDWFNEDESIQATNIQNSFNLFEKTNLYNSFLPGKRYFFSHPIPDNISNET